MLLILSQSKLLYNMINLFTRRLKTLKACLQIILQFALSSFKISKSFALANIVYLYV